MGCCDKKSDSKEIYQQVNDHYGAAARENGDTTDYGRKVAEAFGYSEEELKNIPQDANLGLSCGNPVALAKMSEGETVIDLGSGAGFDAFLAAKRVGETGKVIGVDMNTDMLDRANRNKENAKADNVSFVESYITDMKLPDGIADCIISNCVVNLVPEAEKQTVFNEMARLLKPRGRIALSDILARKELPTELKESMALYVGCIAGASQVKQYEEYLRNAGFNDTLIVDAKNDLNVYVTAKDGGGGGPCCGPTTSCAPQSSKVYDAPNVDFNEWAGSFKIYAVKS